MRILITGATGFIGCRLAQRAAAEGFEVVAFGAENTPIERTRKATLESAGVSVQVGTLSDLELLRRLVKGCDVVFHLAAAQHEAGVPDEHFEKVNVHGTRDLLEICAEARVGRFVYGSTIGVYGSALDGALDERSSPRPQNIYGVTKLAAEGLVRAERRMPFSIVRISETYGPGDGRLLKLFKSIDKGLFPLIGGGRNERHPVHVDDLVDGLLLAATRPEAVGETFVLAGSEVLTTRETAELVAAALGKPLRSIRLPLWPFYFAAVVFEKTLPPLGIAPPWHRRRLDFFVKRFYFSLEKAERLLGYEPKRRFREGAAETAAWYRAQGYL
jgi:nucleoside-diphosphate-sugar epimerase